MGDTERSLYQAVLDNPDDLAPRVRYADFIREDNPDRARFIDLQIETFKQRRAVVELGVSLKCGDWCTPFGYAKELLDQHRQEWAKNVSDLVDEFMFLRGFVESIDLDAATFLETGHHLYSLAPIRYVELTNVNPVIEQLFASELLEQIVALYITDQTLGDEGTMHIANCPHLGKLRMLEIDGNDIGEPGLEYLAASNSLPNLEYINFHGNLAENPTDHYAVEPIGQYIVEAWHSEIGEKLENKFGYLKWIHGPHLFPSRYPPLPGDY